jgi:hypothetical protein
MAIRRKNREFSKIMNDVELVTIPIMFIKKLYIFLDDGKEIYFEGDDIRELDSIEQLIYGASFSDQINDIRVELDFTAIEKTITQQVKALLDKDDND